MEFKVWTDKGVEYISGVSQKSALTQFIKGYKDKGAPNPVVEMVCVRQHTYSVSNGTVDGMWSMVWSKGGY